MKDQALGKVDRAFFNEHIYPYLGSARDDVALGPRHGVDFGMLDVDGTAVVVATDPLSIIPALRFETAARFGLHVALADVAVSGIPPSHLAVSLAYPPDVTDEAIATVQRTFHEEASDLGATIVTGHTARYAGASFPWVGAATVVGVGAFDDVVRPDGARPGDRVLVTKGPGAEAVGLLATLFGAYIDLPADVLESAAARFEDTSVVRDALIAAAAGPVTAMHDATEGGLQGALVELADGAGVHVAIDRETVPSLPGVEPFCAYFDMDSWTVTSAGTLLLTVAPEGADDVRTALEDEGILATEVGWVEPGSGVTVDGVSVAHPEVDPSWTVYADLADRSRHQD